MLEYFVEKNAKTMLLHVIRPLTLIEGFGRMGDPSKNPASLTKSGKSHIFEVKRQVSRPDAAKRPERGCSGGPVFFA
jgi:hypothetical protein